MRAGSRGTAPAAYALSTSKASMLRDSGSNATPVPAKSAFKTISMPSKSLLRSNFGSRLLSASAEPGRCPRHGDG